MPSDDLVLNVRQIAGYGATASVQQGDVVLVQRGGLGGPYVSMSPGALVGTALATDSGSMVIGGQLSVGSIQGGRLQMSNGAFGLVEAQMATLVQFEAGFGSIGGVPVATQDYVDNSIAGVRATSVWSFNGRQGDICLSIHDILRAGGAPQFSPVFGGQPLAPTPDASSCNSQIATTLFVQRNTVNYIDSLLATHPFVFSFNGRSGDVVLTNDDVNTAIEATGLWAPVNSPNFTGVPQAPTAASGTNTSQIATTSFVMHAVASSTTGVSMWNGRSGNVTMTTADVTAAGGAPLSSPAFIGTPTAPLAPTNANTTQIANCEWVMGQLSLLGAQVQSFNGRTGAVTLQLADVTGVGGAPISSPTFTGLPAAPNPINGDNSTRIATTAWVTTNAVVSFNGRQGAVTLTANDLSAVGGALLASPAFTGVPTVPTASPGTATLQAASTAFVTAAIGAIGAAVTSFNTRTGAVVLSSADVTAAGWALLAGPTFTGTPQGPTAAPGTNTTQLATTAFVAAAIAGATTGVASFNSRTGIVTLTSADITGAGGALLSGPAFVGVPTAPTATAGSNTTQIATTAFVAAAVTAGVAGYLPLSGGALTGPVTSTSYITANGSCTFGYVTVNNNIQVTGSSGVGGNGSYNGTLNVGGVLTGGQINANTAFWTNGTLQSNGLATLASLTVNGVSVHVGQANFITSVGTNWDGQATMCGGTQTGAFSHGLALWAGGGPSYIGLFQRVDRTDCYFTYFMWGTGTGVGSINTNGAATNYNSSSDYRLKTDFGEVDHDDIGAIIDAVPVHDAEWKVAREARAEESTVEYVYRYPMFFAHELQEKCPWAVTGTKDEVDERGEIKSQQADPSKVIPVLWAEIQNLRSRVAALEAI